MGAIPRADCIWKTLGRILRKRPSSQNVQAAKAPGQHIPAQPAFLRDPCSHPVGCNIHTDFSPAAQRSHGHGSEGQWCDSSITHGTRSPPLQTSLRTGGSWGDLCVHCGTWHDATTQRRDQDWEENLGWGCWAGSGLTLGLRGILMGAKLG